MNYVKSKYYKYQCVFEGFTHQHKLLLQSMWYRVFPSRDGGYISIDAALFRLRHSDLTKIRDLISDDMREWIKLI